MGVVRTLSSPFEALEEQAQGGVIPSGILEAKLVV